MVLAPLSYFVPRDPFISCWNRFFTQKFIFLYFAALEIVRLTLDITDLNDEPPVFDNIPAEMIATVGYNALKGTKVYQLQASDPDNGAKIRYEIVSGEFSSLRFRTSLVEQQVR